MQKIRLLTLLTACIAAASVTYYFGIYLPRVRDAALAEQRRKADLGNSLRCGADGRKFYSDFRRSLSPSSGISNPSPGFLWQDPVNPGRWWLDPEMHFSKKLNTCLVALGFDDSMDGGTSPFRAVIDIYSNQEIISTAYTLIGGVEKPVPDLPHNGVIDGSKGFLAEKDKLFRE
jgi:hypothetical protein